MYYSVVDKDEFEMAMLPKEEHLTHEFGPNEEIHSWYFANAEQLQESKLYKEMEEAKEDFDNTVIHLNETGDTLILADINPVKFVEFEIGSVKGYKPTDFIDIDENSKDENSKKLLNQSSNVFQFDTISEFIKNKREFPNLSRNLFLVGLYMESGMDGIQDLLLTGESIFITPKYNSNLNPDVSIGEAEEEEVVFEAQGLLKLLILPIIKLKRLLWIIKVKTIMIIKKIIEITKRILQKTKMIIVIIIIKVKIITIKTILMIKYKLKKLKMATILVLMILKEKIKFKILKTKYIILKIKDIIMMKIEMSILKAKMAIEKAKEKGMKAKEKKPTFVNDGESDDDW
ncbi:uncharacterized protein KGF55_002588 [Candida pseudojiufengensis]|uniref:uncharacterized protein n=1 Tax=Candida pseudojiufengensis TaxID=497109 RepID=UPI0022245498|nr:uncharacterized protein KGF55_002588 [Candida pseudojiufengensis]KAI5963708.1 hypothetical protein KGF55_002588 [Candida pseudojiufengensis]